MSDETTTSKEDGEALPGIDFSTFILSLSTSALYQMGLVGDPETGHKMAANPVLARHSIDTLEMLREKTRGNLGDNEAKLLDSMIYELRMKFVEIGQ